MGRTKIEGPFVVLESVADGPRLPQTSSVKGRIQTSDPSAASFHLGLSGSAPRFFFPRFGLCCPLPEVTSTEALPDPMTPHLHLCFTFILECIIIFPAVSKTTATRDARFLILFTIVKQSFWEACLQVQLLHKAQQSRQTWSHLCLVLHNLLKVAMPWLKN